MNSYTRRRLTMACDEIGADPNLLASTSRASHTVLRERVTAHMRAPDAAGMYCSFPEIAQACGRKSHSTFIEAYQRHLTKFSKSQNPENCQ